MANSTKYRMSPDTPLIREYMIIEAVDLDDGKTTICKFLKRQKTGQKDAEGNDIWDDKVNKEWVHNPAKKPLLGMKIRLTSEIVE